MLFKNLKNTWMKKAAVITATVLVSGNLSTFVNIYASDTVSEEAAVVSETNTAENTLTEDLNSLIDELNPEDILWPEMEEDILEGKDVVNILLIGQDSRDTETKQRSDTMILATLNMEKNKVSLTSFMRDLYVQIPGYGSNRINAAYPFGGMELLDEVIETNFGIQIDGNIEVDFSGFQKIIDLLEGVEIELSQAEIDYINKSVYNADAPVLTEGVNLLNGEQALAHARNRSVGNSDYDRTERQREVVLACFEKVKETNVFKLLGMVDDAFNMIETDLTYGELLGYAKNILDMGFDSVESYRIPQDGAFYDATISGMMVLVPDLTMCRDYLVEIL